MNPNVTRKFMARWFMSCLRILTLQLLHPFVKLGLRGPGRGRGRLSSKGRAAHGGELQDAAMAAPAERNDAQFRGEREVGEKKRRERGRHGGVIQLASLHDQANWH